MDIKDVRELIRDYTAQYPKRKSVRTLWQEPLVESASAADPLFMDFKKIIHSGHLTPQELLPGAESVIAFYLPFEKDLHRENHREKFYCSRSWAVAYVETNRLIADITFFLKKELERVGRRAALIPATHNFDKSTLKSDWSHRHAAFTAGLGRLGFHNLLITEKGCTGRLGSLVTDLELPPSPRPSQEYCLHKAGQTCLKCVARCTYGALEAGGYDRFSCYAQCRSNDSRYPDLSLTEICGKCAALVPCSTAAPALRSRSHAS
jgi:epoxyqueuosine reductase QueG